MELIYAIPGLGTTKELFQNISVPNHQLKVLEWPVPEKNQTLKAYAGKFLSQIDQSRSVNLLGVSFGGMLCAELAESLATHKVFLISSCSNRNEFPFILKALKCLPLYRLYSESRLRSLEIKNRKIAGFEKSFEPTFIKMVNAMPQDYFTHCIHCIINWNKTNNTASIVKIHGTADRLLLHRHIKKFHAVKGGSHNMILDKAGEINAILNHELNGL